MVKFANCTVKLSSTHIKIVKFATNSLHACPNIVIFKNVHVFGEKKCPGKVIAVLDFYKFNGTVSTVPNLLCRDTVDKRPKHAYFD